MAIRPPATPLDHAMNGLAHNAQQPQRVSPGVYRMPNGQLQHMQAPSMGASRPMPPQPNSASPQAPMPQGNQPQDPVYTPISGIGKPMMQPMQQAPNPFSAQQPMYNPNENGNPYAKPLTRLPQMSTPGTGLHTLATNPALGGGLNQQRQY